jgi:hypothetical protein
LKHRLKGDEQYLAKQSPLALFGPLVIVLILGLVLGVAVGHSLWSPSASKYETVSLSAEATRMVQVGRFTVTFPSVVIASTGNTTTIDIEIVNQDNFPRFVEITLSLVASSTIDSETIADLTATPLQATLGAAGSISHPITLSPTSAGYAILDIWVRGELAGSMTVYVVK